MAQNNLKSEGERHYLQNGLNGPPSEQCSRAATAFTLGYGSMI